MSDAIRTFGTPIEGVEYTLRPGGYLIARDRTGALAARDAVAVVETPAGLFLPGGGQDPGESPEDAAVREAREECGLVVADLARIGAADELVRAAAEGRCYRKRCVFFTAEVVARLAGEGEHDHRLLWLPAREASERLNHASQRWAISVALGLGDA